MERRASSPVRGGKSPAELKTELPARNSGLSARDRNRFVRSALEPPDHAAQNHQPDRDHLCSAHQPAKRRAASRIPAQEFQKEPSHSVQDQVSAEYLAIKFLALQHPHQQEEVRQLDCESEKLRGLEGLIQRGADQIVPHRIRESHATPGMRRLTNEALGGITLHPTD